MMKVLFINSSLTDGGSERAMTLVANQFVKFGHEVSMLLVRDKKRTYWVDSRIDTIQLNYPSSSKLRILPRRLRLIRKFVKQTKPDCIVSFMWDINVMMLVATLGLKPRKVISERAFPESPHRSKLSRILEKTVYGLADVIVYQTEMARSFCPRRLIERSVVIPNIVDKPKVAPHEGQRSKRIVSVGRLAEQKNFSMLISAFAGFSKVYPEYVLEIYGVGELRLSLEKLAVELGIDEKIRFKGYVPNVAKSIRDAAMFVLPSNYEGISNAMTEAMALGLPVICTDCPVGGASMIIEDGVNGFLVPVGDVDALERAMERVILDKALAKRVSIASMKLPQQYSAVLIGRRWESIVE